MKIEQYLPDLDKVAYHSKDPQPRILTKSDYYNWLDHAELRAGLMSDEGILKAMEEGLIKVTDPSGCFDLLAQIQPSSLDLRLGNEFWFFGQHEISRLTMGRHRQVLQELNLLNYGYKPNGVEMVFHRDRFLLALTAEQVTLSNVVLGSFDGRSTAARLGITNHQTAGGIEPTFSGQIVMEISNQNDLDIAVVTGDRIATLRFELLSSPSTRIRSSKPDTSSFADGQVSPFGYRLSEWDDIQNRAVHRYLAKANQHGN